MHVGGRRWEEDEESEEREGAEGEEDEGGPGESEGQAAALCECSLSRVLRFISRPVVSPAFLCPFRPFVFLCPPGRLHFLFFYSLLFSPTSILRV